MAARLSLTRCIQVPSVVRMRTPKQLPRSGRSLALQSECMALSDYGERRGGIKNADDNASKEVGL